jgi:type II secretory pathway component PulF
MPTYEFEAMDATGMEIKDTIDAPSVDEAQATIRQMGYFVTKICPKRMPDEKAESKLARIRARKRALDAEGLGLSIPPGLIWGLAGFAVGTIFGLLLRVVFQ